MRVIITESQRKSIEEFYKTGKKPSLIKEAKDEIKGGKADGKTLRDVCKYWAEKTNKPNKEVMDILEKEYKLGIKIEREHTSDINKQKEITLDHLMEEMEYYSKRKPKDWAEKELEKEDKGEKLDEAAMARPKYREGDIVLVDMGDGTEEELTIRKVSGFKPPKGGFSYIYRSKEYEKTEPNMYFAEDDVLKLIKSVDGSNIRENKTEFSTKEREELAKKKEALPDGSFPIRNKQDLKDAIKSFGRAKDPQKAKAWIKKRAKELDAAGLIPEKW